MRGMTPTRWPPRGYARGLLLGLGLYALTAATALCQEAPAAARRLLLVTWVRPTPHEALAESSAFQRLARQGLHLEALRPPEGDAARGVEVLLTGLAAPADSKGSTAFELMAGREDVEPAQLWLVTGSIPESLALPGDGARKLHVGDWPALRDSLVPAAELEPPLEALAGMRRVLAGSGKERLPPAALQELEGLLLRGSGTGAGAADHLALELAETLITRGDARVVVAVLGSREGRVPTWLEAVAGLFQRIAQLPDHRGQTLLALVPAVRPPGGARNPVPRRPRHSTHGVLLGPKVPPGESVKRVVTSAELLPTWARLLGLPPQEGWGRPLRETAR